MPAPVTHDLDHPDFPHGTTRGYHRKCDRECCLAAHRRQGKKDRLHRGRGYSRVAPPELAQRMFAHVERLTTAVPGSTPSHVAQVAGIPENTVREAIRRGAVTTKVANATLTVTPAALMDKVGLVERQAVLDTARKVQALGYTFRWMTDQSGVDVKSLMGRSRNDRMVRAAAMEPLLALLARVGDTAADPHRDGIDPRSIARAKSDARSRGYYPPACYDDAGNLDPRSVPGHPWTVTDDYAHDKVRDLRIITARNYDEELHRTARALGLDSAAQVPPRSEKARQETDPELWRAVETLRRSLERARKALGMRDMDATREANTAMWREQLAVFEHSGEDAVTFAMRTGLLHPGKKNISNDHPSVAAYLADTAEEAA